MGVSDAFVWSGPSVGQGTFAAFAPGYVGAERISGQSWSQIRSCAVCVFARHHKRTPLSDFTLLTDCPAQQFREPLITGPLDTSFKTPCSALMPISRFAPMS